MKTLQLLLAMLLMSVTVSAQTIVQKLKKLELVNTFATDSILVCKQALSYMRYATDYDENVKLSNEMDNKVLAGNFSDFENLIDKRAVEAEHSFDSIITAISQPKDTIEVRYGETVYLTLPKMQPISGICKARYVCKQSAGADGSAYRDRTYDVTITCTVKNGMATDVKLSGKQYWWKQNTAVISSNRGHLSNASAVRKAKPVITRTELITKIEQFGYQGSDAKLMLELLAYGQRAPRYIFDVTPERLQYWKTKYISSYICNPWSISILSDMKEALFGLVKKRIDFSDIQDKLQ